MLPASKNYHQLYVANITTSPTSFLYIKIKRVFWVWAWQIAKSFIVSESDSKFLNKSKKYEVLIGRKFFHFRASHWLFSIYFHASEYCIPLVICYHDWNIAFDWFKILNAEKCFGFGLYKFGFLSFATEMNLKARFSLIRFFRFFAIFTTSLKLKLEF